MGRKILAVIVALVTGWAIFLIAQMIASMFATQPPKNFEYMTHEEMTAYVASLPIGSFLSVLFGYWLGSLAAGWLVTKISKSYDTMLLPLIVGGIFFLGGIANFFVMLPGQPVWFILLSLVGFIGFALLGHRIAKIYLRP